MDNSMGSAIEKIKFQEQDIENRLKEKREHETALSTLIRAIKDAVLQVAKSEQEHLQITERIQKIRSILQMEKIKREALLAHLETYTKLFEYLKAESNKGIAEVWSLRSSLCETVQTVSNDCDIRALLMKPVFMDTLPQAQCQQQANKNDDYDEKVINYENRLKAALQRRKDVETTREKLLIEPESGEQFVRIKNALRYSLHMTANT